MISKGNGKRKERRREDERREQCGEDLLGSFAVHAGHLKNELQQAMCMRALHREPGTPLHANNGANTVSCSWHFLLMA
jgi:hypothetical protein